MSTPQARTGAPVLARTRQELAAVLAPVAGGRAVVMTMGALHAGHLALVREARARAEQVVVTIFVNPIQFGPGEDLDRYPRDLAGDLDLLTADGLLGAGDVVFAPAVPELYPDGDPVVRVDAGRIGRVHEGAVRPGHLDGALTVVLKLLHLTRPDRALFGRKDVQQLVAVTRMVADLDLDVQVVGVPTVRDPDGLALSSRNAYLDPARRDQALGLSRALAAGRQAATSGAAPQEVRAAAAAVLAGSGVRTDYVALVDPVSFADVTGPDLPTGTAVLAVAGTVGSTRLIDNTDVRWGPA
ncbi:MAG TPA: pantoate--beta-alanine ligase [Cellulomonas sp.]